MGFEKGEKEQVDHAIYATQAYGIDDDEQTISVKPYLIKCTEAEFKDYCSRETANHIIKAVHKH